MKKWQRLACVSASAAMLWLVGCSTQHSARPPEPAQTASIAPLESGPTVAEHLQKRFDEKMADCGSATRPAFLCSGILMRSTNYSPAYHSWIPNPANASTGVAFSWLRQDSNFDNNYPSTNGFIVYPRFFGDDGNYELLTVRCGYPMDGGTSGSPDRCRTTCQALGVFTADQWIARLLSGLGQCAFGVSPGTADTASAWLQILSVRQKRAIFLYNEIILAEWPQGTTARMPLEAFFVRTNGANGLPSAQADQKDFRAAAGRWVPIIRWTPATSSTGRATFTYNAADQAILN